MSSLFQEIYIFLLTVGHHPTDYLVLFRSPDCIKSIDKNVRTNVSNDYIFLNHVSTQFYNCEQKKRRILTFSLFRLLYLMMNMRWLGV